MFRAKDIIRTLVLIIISLYLSGEFLPASNNLKTNSLIVSTEWLSEHLNDSNLVILHVGKKDNYNKGHLPGARLFSLRDIIVNQTPEGLNHEFPTIEKLESVFKSVGVNKESKIVICYDNEMLVPLATRLYVTLDYMGMGDHTSILDGGLQLWLEENRSISTEQTEVEVGNFKANLNEKLLVDAKWINENLKNPDIVLLDGRPEEQYSGREEDGHATRQGHIAGAVNIPFYDVMLENPAYRFKNIQELEKMFLDNGVKAGSIVVPYCGTGIWSCPIYFVSKHLGFNTHFYDASFQEWSADETLTVIEPVKLNQIK
jgi:thiosulfate/3-mercaptopyruvate sulfurtransferase